MGIDMGALLYLQEFGLLTPEKNKMLDIGPQNVYHATSDNIKRFVANQGQSVSDEILEREADRLVYFSTPRPDERTTLLSEITDLTFIEYNSYDVCPGLKTDIIDLNHDSILEKDINYYDVVLNFGTTEHIFNQWNCFKIIHDAMRVGGAIYHRLPATGYLDHGYFSYTPLFFKDLAKANDYEIIDLFYTLAGMNEPLKLGFDIRDPDALLVPSFDKLTVFERRVPCFDAHAVLRKRRNGRFRSGLEVATAHAAVNQTIALRYATEDELRTRLVDLGAERDAIAVERDGARFRLEQLHEENERRIYERDAAIAERDRALAQLARITHERDDRLIECDVAIAERDEASAQLERTARERDERLAERDTVIAERDEAFTQLDRISQEKDERLTERDAVIAERDGAFAQLQHTARERDGRLTERDAAIAERDEALTQLRRTVRERDDRLTERDAVIAERDEALTQLDRITHERDERLRERDGRLTERDAMIAERDEALTRLERAAIERDELRKEVAERKATLALLHEELDTIRESLFRSNTRIEAIARSTSWRVTSPLRKVGGLMRGRNRLKQKNV